jgi:hypothetical protein
MRAHSPLHSPIALPPAEGAARLNIDLPRRFLFFLAIVLAGYAIDGRGFAYIGVPPLFIGEISLLIGVVTFLSINGWWRVLMLPQALAIYPLLILGIIATIPYVSVYGFDTFRDAVTYGYAVFAFIVAAVLMADPTRLLTLITWYRRFWRVFLCTIPIIYCITHFLHNSIPTWPFADQHIIQLKEGDVLVHLAGIICFWIAGYEKDAKWQWVALMTGSIAIMGVIDRAGLVTFLIVLGLCMVLRPKNIAPWRLGTMIVVSLFLLWASDVKIPVPGGKDREVSFQQIIDNLASITGQSSHVGLEGTKEWRLQWWTDIVNYTVHGKYFWSGKGFGVNLADDDGYQVGDGTLRSPHNVHMTILARLGVPGIVIWAMLHLTMGASFFMNYLRARMRGDEPWMKFFMFIFAFWLAFLINGSFDVFIEGPMGGIWFWTIVGTGMAAIWIYKNYPEALDHPGPELSSS